MGDIPEPRYANNGDVHIAYQVVGDGPVDLVYTPGIWSNLDVMWEWPGHGTSTASRRSRA